MWLFDYVLFSCNCPVLHLLLLTRNIERIRESESIIGKDHHNRESPEAECRKALCPLKPLGVALTTFLHPQREYQPFSLQCEAVYEALKMPYQILPQQLPQKKLQVSSRPEVCIKEGKLKNVRSRMRTWIEAGLAFLTL